MQAIFVVSTIALWIVVLFNLLLTFALIRRLNTNKDAPGDTPGKRLVELDQGDQAPAFTAQTLQGDMVSNATYAGSKLALIFVSRHCGPCHELLPKLIALKSKAEQSGVELILVSTDEMDATLKYVDENNITLPVLVAPQKTNSFMRDYKASGTPSYCFITAQNTIYAAGGPYFEKGEWKSFNEFSSSVSVPVASRGR